MGIGNYIRNASEHLLIAVKGKHSINPAKRHLSWFIAERRQHSRKPENQYDIAEILGKPPYAELFARKTRNGWHSWGNEVNKFDSQLPLAEKQDGGNGIPPTNKLVGILPKIL
jgi:N6-adenosine-specific RNA methylase IME4